MKLKLHRVAEFTGAVGNVELDAVAEGYSIDSRTIQPGELFFAVKGERLDGHDFVEAALQKGEIGALAKLAHADIGVVTNVAPVHLEFFSSIADIARAKYELIQELHSGATAILNADDEYVSQFGRDFHGKVVHYGIHHQANVSGKNVESLGAAGSRFELLAN